MNEQQRDAKDRTTSTEPEETDTLNGDSSESTDEADAPQDQTVSEESTSGADASAEVLTRDRPADRDAQPREGESPAQPPREEPPAAEEAEITDKEPWWQVPNQDGFGGVPWEELRKGTKRASHLTPEQRLWDDSGVSKPQQIDYPKKTWDELPEQSEPSGDEKISTS
jgi:hypothetical protein